MKVEIPNSILVTLSGQTSRGVKGIEVREADGHLIFTLTDGKELDMGSVMGPQGPKGDTGSGFKVLGYYATVAALSAAVANPEAGMAYGVGTAEPYDIYIYDSVSKSWKNNGPLQGAKGDTGVGVANVTFDDDVMTVNLTSGAHYSSGSLRGPQGVKGDAGAKGEKGDPGAQGEKGDKGDTGAVGPQGPQGETGPKGADGTNGTNGITPTIGANGNWYLGSTDTTKPSRGAKGDKGNPGDKGETGDTGPQGPQGEKGDTGSTGPQGPKGDPGETGPQGPAGHTPVKGTDYWTAADQTSMVNDVLAALPTWSGGAY